jgi:hypothetical protein
VLPGLVRVCRDLALVSAHDVARGREVTRAIRNRANAGPGLAPWVADIARVVRDISREIADLAHVRGDHEDEARTSSSWSGNLSLVV